ncbi:LysR family transcriptional regulator [Neorhizobium sp. P12A]|uniref:LysR family transcriptional regulator n=1 Tax=Neorhizobium sp. P12A TaxID=2268027 RepID=UPI0011EC2BAB|nr:LysR family transcriptional regulator [Neorhizobium sp. P12A]KAA0698475.1 LysR family transcriptional regulator [Neorhizobium sp. P12A]
MSKLVMERLGEMEVFVRVVHEGGFSKAARSLDLTPSAVSKLIARLEERLGARLLVRTTRSLTLTDEGRAFFEASGRILQEVSDAEDAAASGSVRGRLRITSSLTFGNMYVVPHLDDFLARNPDLAVELAFTDDLVSLLAQQADVAIRIGPLSDSSLTARKIGDVRRVVCASPNYLDKHGVPAVPADLEPHQCMSFTFRTPKDRWPFLIGGNVVEQLAPGSIEVNNGETMRHLLLTGAGIARVGRFIVADDIEAGRVVPLLEDFNPGDVETIHAVYVGAGPLPRRVRAFIDFLMEVIPPRLAVL